MSKESIKLELARLFDISSEKIVEIKKTIDNFCKNNPHKKFFDIISFAKENYIHNEREMALHYIGFKQGQAMTKKEENLIKESLTEILTRILE